jgi:phosphoglycolate phosphatase-like HAD superfamily hydrolase
VSDPRGAAVRGCVDGARRAFAAAEAIVFDFDGTLVDSNEIKWRGFETVFAEHAGRLAEISAYCRSHNHTPRDDKFRFVCERILGFAYTHDVAVRLNAAFAAATTAAIVAAPEVPGSSALVRHLANDTPLGLLSSTPHAVLEEILVRRGLRDPFHWVQGAPVDKARWLAARARALGVPACAVAFVGDTVEDREAAAAAGCVFVGVRNPALAGETWVEDFAALA